ncbi:type 2 isopentenyl-diphosphate Delta-isomerase [Vagococcus intermedius]|uniref:Isopentenyl-diphosphate delta-isomerase n=1 Tax=Vagococcus intermedius TaxID=2991418 RepID=A0AAF0CTP7_9ENTE|nr:type 2 isopentenyl-diphosphate Delta-isomerase [Vagococcus intermedius]WEG72657.1 type 2 isopentenyl-diphosphate Delta-isomerase [Vagococcus intermedius]WEG74742.1 type 2 isopentenyl-diphosphate Delta-isomerase [Vagococcus intermedius]
MSIQQHRKDEHVSLATQQYIDQPETDFDAISFVHHSLPNIDVSEVSLATEFADMDFDVPIYINGMTGGSPKTAKINEELAIVARETGLAMAAGSVSAALKHSDVAESYTIIRKMNPNGKIFANLGAEHSVENGKRAVDLLQADALQIHVNVPQELIMPEGERRFATWLSSIENMVSQVGVPVIVKEVGFGMSRKTIQQLLNIGVKTIDISGRGGTNFAAIENSRRKHHDFYFAENWGQSTPISLIEAYNQSGACDILASGGIRTSLDMIKAFALGAHACGLSGQFLHLIQEEGVDETIMTVNRWEEQLKIIMTLLGAKRLTELKKTDVILRDPIKTWCEARHIDWTHFANRSK